MFYSSIGKIPAEYFMVKIPSNFLAFCSTFFFTLCFIYCSVEKNIQLCTFSGNEAFRELHFHRASYSRYYLSLSVFVSFLLQLRWYVRFNEKGVVRDRNGTRMRSRLLQRAVVVNVHRITRSVTQEGWFSFRKGSFLEFRLPTLGADVISRLLDGELLFRSRIHSIF